MAAVEVLIDGQKISAAGDCTILTAARKAGIYIPALCSHPALPATDIEPEEFIYQNAKLIKNEGDLNGFEPCGLCLVHVDGQDDPVRACHTQIEDGMVIFTDNAEIQGKRREKLKEILGSHPNICLTCDRVPRCPPFGVCVRSANVANRCVACPGYAQCELIHIADHIGMLGVTIPYNCKESKPVDDNPFFEFDPALCVGCLRCVRLCRDVRGIGALGYVHNNGMISVGTKSQTFKDSGCHFCLGCVEICPTGAITDKKEKWKPLKDREERRKDLVPCSNACPLGIDIPQYVYHISQNRYAEALAIVQEKLPFPFLCGTICTHPCEEACRRGEMDDPVAIKHLKRFAAERADMVDEKPVEKKSGKQVAVVGSGPAGLTAAYLLAKKGGHTVTILEALPKPGGMPLAAIPRFRLPKEILDIEIERVTRLGVDIITNSTVESVDDLFNRGFDAILMATGAHHEISLGIEGEDSPSVVGALAMLRQVNLGRPPDLGEKVVVVGGGNAAVDAARVALRLGARDVRILYRRSQEEMPADPDELAQAEAEGVNIMFLASPTLISVERNRAILHLIRNKLTRRDTSGRRRPKPIKGTDFSMEVDTVVTAIGQHSDIPAGCRLDTDKKNTLKVDKETLMTSREGVFAAGDVVSGPRTVTGAIAMGEKAANAINRYIGGKTLQCDDVSEDSIPPLLDQNDQFFMRRVPMQALSAEKRRMGFEEVELGYTEDMAVKEANRCLHCSLRLDILG